MANKFDERYIIEFKRDYYLNTKHDLKAQVPHLARLADYYKKRYAATKHWADCLKAHALYNSAAVRQPDQEGWAEEAFSIQKSFWDRLCDVSLEKQTNKIECLKTQLKDVRNRLKTRLSNILVGKFETEIDSESKVEFTDLMQNVSQDCSTDMLAFACDIIRESVTFLKNPPPCDFCVLAIGSLARGEATPYSDLEYLFLIDEKSPNIVEYFETLAVTSYFLIGCLGETTLEYMDIEELNGWFRDQAMSGFKIDGLQKKAGNIPTGNGHAGTEKNRFILTAAELANIFECTLHNPDNVEALRGDLTAMLKYTKVIYHHANGPNTIYDNFVAQISDLCVPEKREHINMEMLKADVEKFNFRPDQKLSERGFTVDVKKELYRFPSILLLDLAIVLQCPGKNAWLAADNLLAAGKVSAFVHQSLKFMLACACYIRLSAYLFHDSHNDSVSVATKSETLNKDSQDVEVSGPCRKWFVPGGLYIELCETTMPIKEGISVRLSELDQNDLDEYLVSTRTPNKHWTFKFFALHSAGRYMDALTLLEQHAAIVKLSDPQTLIDNFGSDNYRWGAETVNDILIKCSRYREALEYASHINAEYCDDKSKLMLAKSHRKLSNLSDALAVLSSLESGKSTDVLLELGSVNIGLGKILTAEAQILQALQMCYNEASEERLYGYYGELIPNTTSENYDGTKPDLIWCTAADRLKLIRSVSPNIIKCLELLSEIYWEDNKLQSAYNQKKDEMLAEVYGQGALVQAAASQQDSLGTLYNARNDFRQSERMHMKALSMYEEMFGKDINHSNIANVLRGLGDLYKETGNYSRAELYSKRALEMYRSVYGLESKHSCINEVFLDLACLYRVQGDYKQAEVWYQKSLAMYRSVYGEDSNQFAIAYVMEQLGSNYNLMREFSKAVDYCTKSLSMYRCLCGEESDHECIAGVLDNLGYIYNDIEEYSKAEDFYLQSLAMVRRMNTNNSHDAEIVRVLNNLGSNNKDRGRFNDADEFYRQALSLNRQIYGEHSNHTRIAMVLDNLGYNYNQMGHFGKAVDFNEQALNMRRQIYGEDSAHKTIAVTLFNLGDNYRGVGNLSKAEESYQLSVAMHRQLYGVNSNHGLIGRALESLGFIYSRMSQFIKAIDYYHQALALWRRKYGENSVHRYIERTLRNLGSSHNSMAKFSEAEDYYHQSLAMLRRIHGSRSKHIDIAFVLKNIANNYRDSGKKDEAVEKYKEALIMYRESQLDHQDIPYIIENLKKLQVCRKFRECV